ncbi:MAG TPA: HD domain-containing protein [Anaerolineaceae bacterium]|jgi:putative nucleotidyltransferase with HDIG domain|nr:HD domain-containing protein [Anaerolineaceae bacterium]HOS53467.1 HD domain-containing protein [Anaerolineaceae bacterium]HPD62219.1 HD domain-containing protein [Anaerolineaceae bacterium]HQF69489.1 HD domain-containing protein [Anaerolineaceae bacterium]HQK05038.1 HD domain-containing protein [Anaerolineaceae bacterium]
MAQTIDAFARYDRRRERGVPTYLQEKWNGLSELNRFLAGSENLEELAVSASRRIVEILEVDFCQILLMDLDGQCNCRARYSAREMLIKKKASLDPIEIENICHRFLDAENNTRLFLGMEHLSERERKSLGISNQDISWIIPMRVETNPIGVLILGQSASQQEQILTPDSYYLVDLIADQLASAVFRAQMNERIESVSIETVIVLSKALETRDLHSASHSKRMAALSEQLAKEFGFSARETRELCWAALLHDIGKIGVKDTILKKKGPLTEEEWAIIKTHPEIGAQIVRGVTGLEKIAPLILAHHERMDGKGYPNGLRGDEIPLGARILAVTDAYTTMTDGRPYQKKRKHQEALQELLEQAGSAYDREVVQLFIQLFNKKDSLE